MRRILVYLTFLLFETYLYPIHSIDFLQASKPAPQSDEKVIFFIIQ